MHSAGASVVWAHRNCEAVNVLQLIHLEVVRPLSIGNLQLDIASASLRVSPVLPSDAVDQVWVSGATGGSRGAGTGAEPNGTGVARHRDPSSRDHVRLVEVHVDGIPVRSITLTVGVHVAIEQQRLIFFAVAVAAVAVTHRDRCVFSAVSGSATVSA